MLLACCVSSSRRSRPRSRGSLARERRRDQQAERRLQVDELERAAAAAAATIPGGGSSAEGHGAAAAAGYHLDSMRFEYTDALLEPSGGSSDDGLPPGSRIRYGRHVETVAVAQAMSDETVEQVATPPRR